MNSNSEGIRAGVAKPLLSIIVPVYNAHEYLRRCVESILHQTYYNLELILVDDGSTDGSGEICDSYQKDKRVRVFHSPNKGQASARNLGLSKSQGQYITFVDDDDWIDKDMYEKLIAFAIKFGTKITGCATLTELSGGVRAIHTLI